MSIVKSFLMINIKLLIQTAKYGVLKGFPSARSTHPEILNIGEIFFTPRGRENRPLHRRNVK